MDESQQIPPFAKLVPCNESAIIAASQVYEAISQERVKYAHHLANMVVGDCRVPLRSLLQPLTPLVASPSPNSTPGHYSSEGTIADDENDTLASMVWPVRYTFSLEHYPLEARLGWTAGYGHSWAQEGSLGKVDFLIAVDVHGRLDYNLKSKHARFNFVHPSGQFGVKPAKSEAIVTINGLPVAQQFHILLKEETICFAGLQYHFSHCLEPAHERPFQLKKAEFFSQKLRLPLPNPLTSATPSAYDVRFDKWTIMSTAGAGAQSVVRSAVSDWGETAAVVRKEYYRKSDRDATDKMVNLLETIKRRLMQEDHRGKNFVAIIHDHFESNAHELYIMFIPLGLMDFRSLLETPNPACYEIMFCQVIAGLAALHKARFLHRDLKPANLVVQSLDPPKAAIIDLAGAVDMTSQPTGLLASPGHGGTIGYMAPECEASRESRYGLSSDIWSLGTVGLQILIERNRYAPFTRPQSVNPFRDFDFAELNDSGKRIDVHDSKQVARNEVVQYLARLRQGQQEQRGTELSVVIASMLAIQPKDRISAEQAMHCSAVQNRLTFEQNALPGQKRQAPR